MKILAFSASLRKASLNRLLIQNITPQLKALGATVEEISLNDYLAPSYNADDQDTRGLPESIKKLSEKINAHQGILIACPEYNHSYPGHFKNLFDWVSSQRPIPWGGKAVAMVSASPSLVGAARCLLQLRVPFEACGSHVYPQNVSLSLAHKAFDAQGKLTNEDVKKSLDDLARGYVGFLKKLV